MIELYFVIIAIYSLLVLGFWLREYTLAALAAIGLLILGTYGIINGIGSYNNFMVYAFSVVNIGLGTYILIRGAYEIFKYD